ncbi:MAG: hypothetical protein AAF806_01375 [Bacteroidota bacterium]
MSLNNERDPFERNVKNSEFNKSAHVQTESRMKGYNLTQKEKSQIWDAVKTRDNNINQENQAYRNPDTWKKRFDHEVEKLRSKEKPELKYSKGYHLSNNMQIKQKAWVNVYQNHLQIKKGIAKTTDKQINNILEYANDNGRGRQPDQQLNQSQTQQQNYTHEFNRQ